MLKAKNALNKCVENKKILRIINCTMELFIMKLFLDIFQGIYIVQPVKYFQY